MLDNSIFELGEAFDTEKYVSWINKLKPTKYIIPDVLDDSEETINNIKDWINNYSHLPGIKIGVVQGKDYESLTKCYLEVSKYCDEIAINFGKKYYEDLLPDSNKDEAQCIGRKLLIAQWLEEGIINKDKKHHLLGCSLPQEFKFYSDFEWVCSIDTSCPIVHGILGVNLKEDGSLDKKENLKLVDLINTKVSLEEKRRIYINIVNFRKNLL